MKKEIDHFEIPINLEKVEATAIKVRKYNSELVIASTYNSPSVEFHKNDYDKLFKLAPAVIAAGNFAKQKSWGSRGNDKRGRQIKEYCENHNLTTQTPEEIT